MYSFVGLLNLKVVVHRQRVVYEPRSGRSEKYSNTAKNYSKNKGYGFGRSSIDHIGADGSEDQHFVNTMFCK